MFPGNFGRMPPSHDEDDDDDDGEAAAQAAVAMLGGQQPGNMNDFLAMSGMLGGGQRGGEQEEDADDDEVDETFKERLVGLTEMFPERLRKLLAGVVGGSLEAAKWTWVNGRSLAWALTATCMIAIMPVVLERERHQFQQEQLAQQRQILLGPGAATGPVGHSTFGALMPAAGLK